MGDAMRIFRQKERRPKGRLSFIAKRCRNYGPTTKSTFVRVSVTGMVCGVNE